MAHLTQDNHTPGTADALIGNGPMVGGVGSGVQPAFLLRLAVDSGLGRTTLYLVPIPGDMSRDQAITEVLRIHDKHVSKLIKFFSRVLLNPIVEVVTIAAAHPLEVEPYQPIDVVIIGPGHESPALTRGLHAPSLGSFVQLHQDVLTTSAHPSALHMGGTLRKDVLSIAIVILVIASFVVGFMAGGPIVGFGSATVVSGLLCWRFKVSNEQRH